MRAALVTVPALKEFGYRLFAIGYWRFRGFPTAGLALPEFASQSKYFRQNLAATRENRTSDGMAKFFADSLPGSP